MVAFAFASLIGGPVWVGLAGLGLPPGPAGAVAIVLLVFVAWWSGPAFRPVADLLATRPWQAGAGTAAVLIAAAMTFKLALFMHDPQQRQWSVQPQSDFYSAHSCLTALTEGVQRAWRGENIYEVPSRTNLIANTFEADPYFYSPPLLLAPAALTLVTSDFLVLRRVWFALQAVSLLAGLLLVARYVGGELGARVAWTIPFLYLATPLLLNLQIGNLQVTVFAAAIGGMILLVKGSPKTGSALLAAAIVAKLFPVVLLAYLVGQRRWRSTMWTVGWCLLFTAGSVVVFGLQPLVDYLTALPGILDGSTPATAVWTNNLWLSPSNESIYGFTRKLVALGVPLITPSVESAVQAAYGILVVAFALHVGSITSIESRDDRSRLSGPIVWLALLTLASFRSPFLPDGYAYVGTLWLGTLIVVAREQFSWRDALLVAAGAALLTPIFGGRVEMPQPFKFFVAMTLLTQGLVLAATTHAVWVRCRRSTGVDRVATRSEVIGRVPA